ncbi:MAG: acyl-CoA dehydrogenase, partial [Pseudorhodoplanes sp.]
GAAQHYRDARIAQIYEGTNGIQAIDLVTRKVMLNGGATVKAYLDELRQSVSQVRAANDPAFGTTAKRLEDAIASLDRATQWILAQLKTNPDAALAGATEYLRLFANAAGGCMLADEAVAAARSGNGSGNPKDRIGIARFFAETIAVQSPSLEISITESAEAVTNPALPGAA